MAEKRGFFDEKFFSSPPTVKFSSPVDAVRENFSLSASSCARGDADSEKISAGSNRKHEFSRIAETSNNFFALCKPMRKKFAARNSMRKKLLDASQRNIFSRDAADGKKNFA